MKLLLMSAAVFLVCSANVFASSDWGPQCKSYFDAVDRFCQVSVVAPEYHDACAPIQANIGDMKQLALETNPQVLEFPCEFATTTVKTLTATLVAELVDVAEDAAATAAATSAIPEPMFSASEGCEAYEAAVAAVCDVADTVMMSLTCARELRVVEELTTLAADLANSSCWAAKRAFLTRLE